MLDDVSPMRVPPSRTSTPKGSAAAYERMARARAGRRHYLGVQASVALGPDAPWRPTAKTIRKLIRAMLEQPGRYTRPQVLVAQAALSVVYDASATPPSKLHAVTTFARMLGAFEADRARRDEPLQPGPPVGEEGDASLADIPVEELLAGPRLAPDPLHRDSERGSLGN